MIGEATVSAPGKTILFGEHAVVYGHAALVATLDHRLTVRAIRDAALPARAVRLHVPSLGIARTVRDAASCAALREPGDLAILAASAALDGARQDATGVALRIDSTIPPGAGFGSSAALAVAVIAACRLAGGDEPSPEDLERRAVEVEQLQHDRSSGVDVTAVVRGGVLRFRTAPGAPVTCEPIRASTALQAFRLFHSGVPRESTGEMVRSVWRRMEADRARIEDAFERIDAASHDAGSALIHEDAEALIPIVRRAEAALETIGAVPEAVRTIFRSIEARGGAAKISGAGGATEGAGLVLVAHPDPAWHDRFDPPPGWVRHPVRLGVPGVRSELAA